MNLKSGYVTALIATMLSLFSPAAWAQAGSWVLPSSAFRAGLNGAEFHTDVRILNLGTSPVTVIATLYDQASGTTVLAPGFPVAGRSQASFDNVLQSLFGKTLASGSYGPIRFDSTGSIIVSSSVNNVNACGTGATSGQWLPGIDATKAMTAGLIAQLAVSTSASAGYRTNLVVMNPGSANATATVKVRAGGGVLLSSGTIGPLGANGFSQVPLDSAGTFPGVAGRTDTNLWVEFTSDQPVLAFASVINNASGDPFAVVATPDAVIPATLAFKTGRYFSPSNILGGLGGIDIAGPGVTDAGAALFSLAAAPGADQHTFPSTATWFVGPMANNPEAARLSKIGITSTAWSYGVGTADGNYGWGTGNLLGFSQIGNALTIVRFTDRYGYDQVTPQDQITFTLGTATAPSATPVASFQAGTYRSPSNILSGQATIKLTIGGGALFSLAAAPGAVQHTYPSTATWFVGPMANNPWATRLSSAGITSTAWSYGVGTSDGNYGWGTGNLLGFSQTGNALTIVRFTDRYGYDQSTPQDEITYTLVP